MSKKSTSHQSEGKANKTVTKDAGSDSPGSNIKTSKAKPAKSKAVVKKKKGRPKQYMKQYADMLAKDLPDMFENGESVAEVCVALNCCKDTFYKMCDISLHFSDSYKKGRDKSEAWWNALGRKGSAGESTIQPATWIFNMKNRFDWSDKNRLSGPDGGPLLAFVKAVTENHDV